MKEVPTVSTNEDVVCHSDSAKKSEEGYIVCSTVEGTFEK